MKNKTITDHQLALDAALRSLNLEKLKYLVSKGLDLNYDFINLPSLKLVVTFGRCKILLYLSEQRLNVKNLKQDSDLLFLINKYKKY